MKHQVFGRKLSRNKNERRRLFQNLARSLIIHGSIKTTSAKAKAVQPLIERLVTHAKKATNSSIRQLRKVLSDRVTANKLMTSAKATFGDRNGGYTRIIRLGERSSDDASMALLSFVTPLTLDQSNSALKPEVSSDKKAAVKKLPKETKKSMPVKDKGKVKSKPKKVKSKLKRASK